MDAKKAVDTDDWPNPVWQQIKNIDAKVVYLANKMDLLSPHQWRRLDDRFRRFSISWFPISCKTSVGFPEFLSNFEKIVEQLCGNPLSETLFTNVRHESHLNKAVRQLELAVESLNRDIAVAAHHLRAAAQQISSITHTITTEDVLDVIFKDFCIGK